MDTKVKIFTLFVFIGIILLFFFVNVKNQDRETVQNTNLLLKATKKELRFGSYLLETRQSLPYLFSDKAKYSFMFIDDLTVELPTQFLRVDKIGTIALYGEYYYSIVTAFYRCNQDKKKCERMLVSSEKQSQSRFPTTEIVSQRPLTVKFRYEDTQRLDCVGSQCYSYIEENFTWDRKQNMFVLVKN